MKMMKIGTQEYSTITSEIEIFWRYDNFGKVKYQETSLDFHGTM